MRGGKVKVVLLQATPEPEHLIATAAKLCYSDSDIEDLKESIDEAKTKALLKDLMSMGHESPIEHANFTFGVEGISRSLSHQLVRHRIASFSQQSQRYVNLDNFPYIIPPEIEQNEHAKKRFIESMEESKKAYSDIKKILINEHTEKFIQQGINETSAKKKAEKISLEDARYVFPNACETKIVFTMNARSLKNFFGLRCCNRAQWEIRNLAIEMLKILRENYPILFNDFGPPCYKGSCTEGKFTCGKAKEVRDFFENL